MDNRFRVAWMAGLGSLLLLQGISAKDINPMTQHHAKEKMTIQQVMAGPVRTDAQRQEEARALGRELLLTGQGVTESMKRDWGELAVEEAQARVIQGIPLNKARVELSSRAGDYEALKVRYHMRSQMLPAWETEKKRLLTAMEAWGQPRAIDKSESALLDKVYDAAYKNQEKIFISYQGSYDPDQLAPYKKVADQAVDALYQSSVSYALRRRGLTENTASPEALALAQQYGKTVVMALDDTIQVNLLGQRLQQVREDYEKATQTYEKLYAKEISRCMSSGHGFLIPNVGGAAGNQSSQTGTTMAGGASSDLLPRSQEERDQLRKELQKKMDVLYQEDWERLSHRRVQYANELEDLGYFDTEAGRDQSMVQAKAMEIPDKRFRIDGEARVDYGAHHGEETIGDRARARVRIYGDLKLDDNWHFISMLENEKILSGRGKNNWMDIDRYYLTGKVGSAKLDAGAFGSYLAEGNVYDARFKGVRVTGETPFSYMAEAGTTNQTDFSAALEASKSYGMYTLGAGLYQFKMKYGGNNRHIYMLSLHRPWGAFDAGVMGLLGEEKNASEKGYVFTLSKGEDQTWKTGNLYYFLKYYHQPYTTYISHTMEGMADYMRGFEGFGAGIHYTVAPDWLLQGAYYSLKDLENDSKNHTIWVALSYYFSNYSE